MLLGGVLVGLANAVLIVVFKIPDLLATLGMMFVIQGAKLIPVSGQSVSSGMVLRDPAIPVAEALAVIPPAVIYDVLLTPFVLPLAMRALRRIEPHQVAYG